MKTTQVLALSLMLSLETPAQTSDQQQIRINEIDADQTSTDNNEFVELTAPAGTSLTDILVVFHDGLSGSVYREFNLDGYSFPASPLPGGTKSILVLGPTILAGFTGQAYNSLIDPGWPLSAVIQNGGASEGDGILVAFDSNTNGVYDDGVDVVIDKWAYVASGSGVNGGSSTAEFKSIYGSTGSTYVTVDATTTSMGRGSDDQTPASGLSYNYTTNNFYSTPSPGEINSGQTTSLPVQLTSLSVSFIGVVSQLRWTTVSEINNFGFEVERRNAGSQSWAKVGFVAGSGTSTVSRKYFYIDQNLVPGRYAYRLKQVDNDGIFSYSGSAEVEVGLAAKELTLSENYPNPFNPTTTIEFTIPRDGWIRLKGEEVATLIDEERKAGVYHREVFNALRLATGVYFSRLEFEGKQLMKKILLLK